MAITINQKAYSRQQIGTNFSVAPAFAPAVFVVSSTLTANINFRYVADVYINEVFKVRLMFSPNSQTKGVVDVSNVLQDYVSQQINGFDNGQTGGSSSKSGVHSNVELHSIHQIDQYSRNNEVMVEFEVKFGEMYQASAGASPIIYDGAGAVGNPSISGDKFQVFNSAIWQFSDLQGSNNVENDYFMVAGTDQFLSIIDGSVKRKISLNQYHTLAFFNGLNRSGTTSLSDRINFRFYNAANSQVLFFQQVNNDANGGSPYNSSSYNSDENLLFVGCGTQNITNSGQTIPSDATYYTMQVVQGGVGRSQLYTFEIDNCNADTERFKQFRLGWLNSLGGFDYYNFTMKNEKSFNIERQTFMKTVGTWQSASYLYQQGERGIQDLNVDAFEVLKLQTDWISDNEVEMMRECFLSPMVWMFEGEDVFPVNVESTNFIEYNQKNDKVFQYELDVKFSHKYRIQNG